MRRYIFVMVIFFLSLTEASLEKKDEMKALGNIEESIKKSKQPHDNIPVGSVNSKLTRTKMKQKTTIFTNVNCKTYEGRDYSRGEAGYNDCIKAIKTDHKGTRAIK